VVAEADIQQSILPEQLGNFTFEQDEAFIFLNTILDNNNPHKSQLAIHY